MPKASDSPVPSTSPLPYSLLARTSGRKQQGYEKCAHECSPAGCTGSKRGILWPREGSSLRRHMLTKPLHPNCSSQCRAHSFMMKGGKIPMELAKYIVPSTEDYQNVLTSIQGDVRQEVISFLQSSRYTGPIPQIVLDLAVNKSVTGRMSATYNSPHERSHSPSLSPPSSSGRVTPAHSETSNLAAEMELISLQNDVHPSEVFACPPKRVHIHYIPDPNMSASAKDMKNHLNYITEDVHDEELQIISAAQGHFSILKKRLDSTRVLIDQWLFVMLCIRRCYKSHIELKITPWTAFLKWIMSVDKEEDFLEWRRYDMVTGLVDYSTEYIRISTGITLAISADFDRRMERLANYTFIWPPLNLIKMAACKWSTIVKLDDIAATVTHTARPFTTLWDEQSIPSDKVLKRCFSSYQEDVYLPDGSNLIMPTVEKLLDESVLPERHWMVQDWVPQLRQLGELKVYVIDMDVIYIAATRYNTIKQGWEFSIDPAIPTLAEMHAIISKNRSRNDFLLWPTQEEVSDSEAGRIELIDFATRTLRALVHRELRGPYGGTTLSKLCRLDIGVMVANDRCHYFISEIERTVGLGIFDPKMVSVIAEKLGKMWMTMM
ncbi:hypothetical protein QCA50_018103 [Cerrena zonata]|uniref:Uncharacterized protein n=1 Tax=Cerrena zonata TaxID=2478898 RepID=A0AAW0FN58_9APHY